MKKLAPICLMLAALASLPFVWLHTRRGLVMVQSYESEGKKWSVTSRYRGDWMRKDLPGQTSIIFDFAGGGVVIITHPRKTFARYSLAQMIAREKAAMGGGAPSPAVPPELADTAKKEKVDGYDSEIYTAETPDAKFTCWITKDYPDYAAVNERVKKYRMLEKTGGLYPDVSKLDGMMVKSEVALSSGKTTTATLVSATIGPIDDSEFQVPAGYTEVRQAAKPAASPAAANPAPAAAAPKP